MGNVQHVNVYDKILKGEYICKGDRLYTREEMKKMLDSSGLSFEEIKMLYDLNAKTTCKDVIEMAHKVSEGQNEGEKVKFLTNNYVYDLMRFLCGGRLFGLFLAGFQGFFALIFCIVYTIAKKDFAAVGPREVSLIFLLLIFSYCLALVFSHIVLAKEIQNDADVLEWVCNDKVELVIMARTRKLFSISNTLNMYECMEDVIKARAGARLSMKSRTEEPVFVDDLK